MIDFKKLPPHERLSYARAQAGYTNATDAARAFGWNENTYRSHENGERGLRLKIAVKYARAFGVTAEFLVVGGINLDLTTKIPLLGYIDQSWNVNFIGDIDTKKTELVASLPMKVGSDFAALEIASDAYITAFRPKDLLIIWFREAWIYIEDNYAIVQPEGGKPILRYVQRGTIPGRYDLSYPAGPYQRNVSLEAAKAMHALLPRGQWFKRNARTNEEVP